MFCFNFLYYYFALIYYFFFQFFSLSNFRTSTDVQTSQNLRPVLFQFAGNVSNFSAWIQLHKNIVIVDLGGPQRKPTISDYTELTKYCHKLIMLSFYNINLF